MTNDYMIHDTAATIRSVICDGCCFLVTVTVTVTTIFAPDYSLPGTARQRSSSRGVEKDIQ
jgi:hypothetical protein